MSAAHDTAGAATAAGVALRIEGVGMRFGGLWALTGSPST